MKFHPGEIVYANAGREKGKYFVVMLLENEFLYLCDGKSRKLENLKKKKIKHVEAVSGADNAAFDIINAGTTLTNRQIRKAISDFKAQLGCGSLKE